MCYHQDKCEWFLIFNAVTLSNIFGHGWTNIFNYVHHITLKCRTAMINFQKIKLIQLVLNIDVTHTLVRGLVTSHLDYCSVIFCGLPEYLLDLLQKVQNATAKLVLGMKKYNSAKVALTRLHWLPIRARIDFKFLTLVHKFLSSNAPGYLTGLLVPLTINFEGLRSNNSDVW